MSSGADGPQVLIALQDGEGGISDVYTVILFLALVPVHGDTRLVDGVLGIQGGRNLNEGEGGKKSEYRSPLKDYRMSPEPTQVQMEVSPVTQ